MASLEELKEARRTKLDGLRARGIDPYPAHVTRTHTAQEVSKRFDELAKTGEKIFLVGRIRGMRSHGGSTFFDIEDGTGQFQVFADKTNLGEKTYEVIEKFTDIGDFVETSGTLFTTKQETKTLEANTFKIISKALRPIPDEYFGLKDTEERLRNRYLDLLANPKSREVFRAKARFWKAVRNYLESHSFIEVDTPALQSVPGGADARPFKTHHNALDRDFYLRISLEIPLKKIIIGGFEKVYEIGKVFRNEGISSEHLQDYLEGEFYIAYADRDEMMGLVENLFKSVVEETTGSLVTEHRSAGEIDWAGKWERESFTDLLEEKLGIPINSMSEQELRKYAVDQELDIEPAWGSGHILDYLWKKRVRPSILGPLFIVDHPVDISPLAKAHLDDSTRVLRFQVVVAGTEVGNGWAELNDPLEQTKRFDAQEKLRAKGDEEAQQKDASFIEALEYGMPPTAGFGFSERLFSVIMGLPIRETVLFPPMREDAHD
jgi:lysyl-tRNA synthetase class 2